MIFSALLEFKYSKVNLSSFNIIPNRRAYIFQAYFLAKGIHEIHLDSFMSHCSITFLIPYGFEYLVSNIS